MKRYSFLLICLLWMLGPSAFPAGAETIIWGESSGIVDGYRVYYEPESGGCDEGDYVNYVDVGSTTSCSTDRLPLSQGVPYCIAVTAYNSTGESGFTESVVWTLGDVTPPLPPTGLDKVD